MTAGFQTHDRLGSPAIQTGSPRRRISPTRFAAVLGITLAALYTALVPLSIMSRQYFNGVVPLVIGVPCAVTGVLIARRQPRNPIGWLLLAIAGCLILGADGGDYSFLRYRLGDHLPLGLVALALNQLWGPGIELFGLVVLLFPDGRLPSAWSRLALRMYLSLFTLAAAALAVATAAAFARTPVQVDSTGGPVATDHPTGWYAHVQMWSNLPIFALLLIFVLRQIVSWRRSSGERRQQLKWLMSGAIVTGVSPLLVAVGSAGGPLGVLGAVGWLGFGALPSSIGIAILRYRLYDIDRIISRTLAYSIVTGLLVGVYAGLVTLASLAGGGHSPLAVAIATLVAAALFSPLRRRVQRIVDRRFNRARYDAERTMAAFSARLQDAVDLDTVRTDLLAAVHSALEPAHASVWLAGGEGT